MPNDQLRWHLLQEISPMLMKKIRPCNQACLASLILSGKGPAQTVKSILSQRVEVSNYFADFQVQLTYHNNSKVLIIPIFLKRIALRWSRLVDIDDDRTDTTFSDIVLPLVDPNCVTALRIRTSSASAIAVVKDCRYLICLNCPLEVFVALFQQGAATFPMLYAVDILNFNGDWRKLFEPWNNHPKQCPALINLSISNQINDTMKMKDFLSSTKKYSIPTIKSLNINLHTTCCCSTIPFAMFASICKVFPNLETASLTLNTECKHTHTKFSEMYECFKRFNPQVKLKFNFNLYHDYAYSGTKRDRLHERLIQLNKTLSYTFTNGWGKYSVTARRSNRTMNFRMKVRLITVFRDRWDPNYHEDDTADDTEYSDEAFDEIDNDDIDEVSEDGYDGDVDD